MMRHHPVSFHRGAHESSGIVGGGREFQLSSSGRCIASGGRITGHHAGLVDELRWKGLLQK